MKLIKSLLTYILLSQFVWTFSLTFAANSPDSFQVEVNPSTFQVNQAVDFTVTALKNASIMKDADFNFFIYITSEDGEDVTYVDYVVPNDGFSNFIATDQGVKKFSKGLLLRKPGTYQLKIVDFQNEELSGSSIIIVHAEQDYELSPINIISPLPGSVESMSPVEIIARSENLPNTRVQVLLNNKMVEEVISTSDGTITTSLLSLLTGSNILQLKAFSIDNREVGSSEIIAFDYKPLGEMPFDVLKMTPNQKLKLGDKVRFQLETDERVSSVKMIFSSGKEYPMDRVENALFVKDVILLDVGDIVVDLQLIALDAMKEYKDTLTFKVQDHIKIGNVKFQTTGQDLSKIDIMWQVLDGEAEHFAVFYGTGEDQLSGTLLTSEQKAIMTGLTYGRRYYFQIQALDENYEGEGLASEIIEFDMPILGGVGPDGNPITGHSIMSDPLCVVKNIDFHTQKIGSRYYMIRKAIDHAEKYRIFRAETTGAVRRLVGETDLTRFEYPFDTTVSGELYAYYSIEAVCKDGSRIMLANAEKVQVGPIEDFLLIISATFLVFFIYRFYAYTKV